MIPFTNGSTVLEPVNLSLPWVSEAVFPAGATLVVRWGVELRQVLEEVER
ncbi:hypothetical protein RintRC_1657 [Richelia intracellularis]|nr:hypothetical protein RintRC_3776 [Richelia intracellularis]CDN12364.1 hypothetical protein RintRC_1657 [Richelia intracellularis]